MLAGTSKEDKEAMLQAQKQAASNTENTIKLMAASTPAPSTTFKSPTPSAFTPTPFTPATFTPQVVMSSTGKPMPVQPPQEEL
jgi:hypothetical protein